MSEFAKNNNEMSAETDNPWAGLTKLSQHDSEKSSNDAEARENLPSFHIENLTPDDNFEQVAEVLYLVDQYIFPDLFEDEQKAQILAKELFSDDPNALFSYDKTLVVKDEDGNIAGVAAWRDSQCTPWDTDAMREKFLATGVELPEHFERANKDYLAKITNAELPEGAAEIEFLGIREDYQGNGLGSRLMKAIIDKPEYTEAHLDVLDSHPNARALYDKLGFKPVGEKFGNYPNGVEGVQHMVRTKE